jgi:hypothetical protein
MTPAQAPLPFLGTWKLAKCESSRPELPHPVSGITTFTQREDGIRYISDTVWSDGRSAKVLSLLQLNGDWCPVTGSILVDTLSFRRLEDGSYEAKGKKGGVDAITTRSTVSADGRTMTAHWEVAGPGGRTVIWTITSDRQ